MAQSPEIQYATSEDGVSIAYRTIGDGPVDLAFEIESWGNVELMLELEAFADLFERLSSFSRLILHDRRGTGLSGGLSFPNLETRTRDLLAVLDRIRSSRAALFGYRTAGAALAVFAATYPELGLLARVVQGSGDEAMVARVPVGFDARRASQGGGGDAGRDGEHEVRA